jgi:adenine-specific DNA-methyltransferase
MPPRSKKPPSKATTRRTAGATGSAPNVDSYRHSARRKNIPPAGLAAHGQIKQVPKTRYFYDPHLPPVLRFDETGKEDRLPELLEEARRRPLTDEEARLLGDALRNHEPWLEWAGKREKKWFDVDPVALHIHERVSTQAILKLAAREPIQRSLFADPELEYREAVRFYEHDVDWTNRLILGDSLTVMHSLARREDLAGKVQMIYIDPPYGIKYAGNFQPEIGRRDVRDRENDLTREPEMVKAYRDTWVLGIHSYLTYLLDRLTVAMELLEESGSIFVQIGDENLHLVRAALDAVVGRANSCGVIAFRKTSAVSSPMARLNVLASAYDYILWYAKNASVVKYRQLYLPKGVGGAGASQYSWVEGPDGSSRRMVAEEVDNPSSIGAGAQAFGADNLLSTGHSDALSRPWGFHGDEYTPGHNNHWKTTASGLARLATAERAIAVGAGVYYKRYIDDFPVFPLINSWHDTSSSFMSDKMYVVQTTPKVIERCLLFSTDPGDIVLDPTCGSGTTAFVAEQWGRRWITVDTSRVALAIARQRMLTAKYEYYELRDPDGGPAVGFFYKTVPHITLKSIAQNQALDPIFARWEPVLAEALVTLNKALKSVTPELRARLASKLAENERREGKKVISDADRRRWLLPKVKWEEWEVPFDTDPDWPKPLQEALLDYRKAWRSKMDEVNACIQASAPQEELVDQPKVVTGVVRVSGPFTVEGVQPAEEALEETPIGGEPETMDTFQRVAAQESANAEAYLEKMIRLLRQDGVRFPDNKVLQFGRLEVMTGSLLHAEGEWGGNGSGANGLRKVAVSIGPQYGPVTAVQVEECLREASRRGFDDLVFAGFTFDGAAQAALQEDSHPKVRCHLAHIRPDVNMGDLLKDTPSSQLFTVFGLPRVSLEQSKEGEWVVEMEGVDIYDPIANTIQAARADKVAAWFLDGDYDGRTFCITQAFFPDRDAWEKLAKALKTVVDPERFEAFSGTRSLPFPAGEHKRAAVKVIDPRGNEVMRVVRLEGDR